MHYNGVNYKAMKRHSKTIKLIMLLMIVIISLLLCGCRSRLTDLDEATTTIEDEDGMLMDEYEMRRYNLDLYETKESLFSRFASAGDSDDEEYDDEEFGDMMEEYEDADFDDEEYEAEENDDSEDDSGDNGTTPSRTTVTRRTNIPVNRTNRTGTSTSTTTTTYVTVKFDANGGSVSSVSKRIASGSVYGTLPVPEKSGYTFEGWYTDKKEGDKVTAKTKYSGKKDHTLYAHWKKIPEESFTVTFDPNGGEIKSGDSSKLLRKGDKYGSFPSVMLEGYKLIGWFTDPEGGTQVSEGDTFSGTQNITIFAQWDFDPYGFWYATLDKVSVKDDEILNCLYVTNVDVDESDPENVTYSFTAKKSDLIERAKAKNVVDEKEKVDVEWIKEKNPAYIVIVKDDEAEAEEEVAKIKGALVDWEGDVIVVPSKATEGNDNEKLYHSINLCHNIYGYFEDSDLTQAAEDLKVDVETE